VHSGESKHNLTLANLWIHHKQSFAISGNFSDRLANIRLDLKNLHNSKRPTIQTTLEGEKIKPTCVLVGIFSMDEIQSVNKVRNSKAWSFRIRKLPKKQWDFTDDLQHVGRELYDANRGISIGSNVFSRSPSCEQEKTRRPTLLGCNFASFNENFYTIMTTVYANLTPNNSQSSTKQPKFEYKLDRKITLFRYEKILEFQNTFLIFCNLKN